MTKYSNELKKQVVTTYFEEGLGYKMLSDRFHIPIQSIKFWVYIVQIHGYDGLNQFRRSHSPIEFKTNVLKYMTDNHAGSLKTAAYFLISPSSVKKWFNIYKKEGIVGLKRKRKVKYMPTNNADKDQQIKRLEAELKYVKMERDILKKLTVVTPKKVKKNSN